METLNDITCCGENPTIESNVENKGVIGFGIVCAKRCGNGIFSPDKETAINQFLQHPNAMSVSTEQGMTHTGVTTGSSGPKKDNNYPKSSITKQENKKPVNNNNSLIPSRNNIKTVFENKRDELSLEVMPILSNSGSAFQRLMKNNTVKYLDTILADQSFIKVSPASIIHEIEEATIMGAELGKMGDIIPFGETCLFIPSVEACDFALTNGINAPFLDFNIKCEYEGDEFESGMKDGNYFVNILKEDNKEIVKNVFVWGTLSRTGQITGEKYSSKRLLEKALESSKPYQKYMKYKKAYDFQKSEGKTEIDLNGRESFKYYESAKSDDPYFEKSVAYFKQAESNGQLKSDGKGDYAVQSIPKKAGGTFDKKIYRYEVEGGTVATTMYIDELKNPYAGANQPEMLKKTAGKSFARPFLKVRNSEAAMHEVRSSKSAMKESSDLANRHFDDDDFIEGEVE